MLSIKTLYFEENLFGFILLATLIEDGSKRIYRYVRKKTQGKFTAEQSYITHKISSSVLHR